MASNQPVLKGTSLTDIRKLVKASSVLQKQEDPAVLQDGTQRMVDGILASMENELPMDMDAIYSFIKRPDLHSRSDLEAIVKGLTQKGIFIKTRNGSQDLYQVAPDTHKKSVKIYRVTDLKKEVDAVLGTENVIKRTDSLEQAIWKAMASYKPMTSRDIASIVCAYGFPRDQVIQHLLKKSHAKPRMYIVQKRNPHDLLQLAPEYAYPDPLPKNAQAELLADIPVLTTTPAEPAMKLTELDSKYITELPCADLSRVDSTDHPALAIWKVMRDRAWYLASEVQALLESEGFGRGMIVPRISTLKAANWFDTELALDHRQTVKGPRTTMVYRLRDYIPNPIKLANGEWVWDLDIVAGVARRDALNYPKPNGLLFRLLTLIHHYAAESKAFESTAKIADHLMEMGFDWPVVDDAITRALELGWFTTKPNHKSPEAPFVKLKELARCPDIVDGQWTDDQAKLNEVYERQVASAINAQAPGHREPSMEAMTESAALANKIMHPDETPTPENPGANGNIHAWSPHTAGFAGVKAEDLKPYIDSKVVPELITAELIIRLKGINLDLEEAKRIVGYFKKNPDRMAPGTGDDLIQSTVTVKGVQLTHQELAQVIEKLDKFVSLF